ncbi:MAG: hypothetical protein HZB46_07380, partial [Solirubrobacterales bacterium]|nr:hypothetical protein [Solirubrobacterales bacterium]
DRLRGGADSDRLEGGGRDDDLRGDAGDDVLVGGNGRDRLRGGSGNDSIRARGDGAVDTVDCGSGRQDRVLRDTRDRVKGCERFGTRT